MMLKRLICTIVALSFVFAGTPVMAAVEGMPCPMVRMQSEMQASAAQSDESNTKMSITHCDECPKSAEKKQANKTKKGGCCDDPACNAKCSALSGAGGQLFLSNGFQWNWLRAKEKVSFLLYLLPPSHLLKTPERPPKYFL